MNTHLNTAAKVLIFILLGLEAIAFIFVAIVIPFFWHGLDDAIILPDFTRVLMLYLPTYLLFYIIYKYSHRFGPVVYFEFPLIIIVSLILTLFYNQIFDPSEEFYDLYPNMSRLLYIYVIMKLSSWFYLKNYPAAKSNILTLCAVPALYIFGVIMAILFEVIFSYGSPFTTILSKFIGLLGVF